MSAVSIYQEANDSSLQYRAVAGRHQSLGRTPGEALDALNAQLDIAESGSLVLIQQIASDPYFSEDQYLHMRDLLDRRDQLTEEERTELEALIREELIASSKRTAALADALGR
jgi:hypothetical protein